VLAVLDRVAADLDRAVCSRRHSRRGRGAATSLCPSNAMTVALRTQGLSKQWGAFKANSDISLSLPLGARYALIGPNGAGKTTFINLLAGVYKPTAGDVYLGDERVTQLPEHARVKRGMTRTFQINTLFPGLTV